MLLTAAEHLGIANFRQITLTDFVDCILTCNKLFVASQKRTHERWTRALLFSTSCIIWNRTPQNSWNLARSLHLRMRSPMQGEIEKLKNDILSKELF
jgi:hypothetical protein